MYRVSVCPFVPHQVEPIHTSAKNTPLCWFGKCFVCFCSTDNKTILMLLHTPLCGKVNVYLPPPDNAMQC